MANEQTHYDGSDETPQNTGADEAYRSLDVTQTNAEQPTRVTPEQAGPAGPAQAAPVQAGPAAPAQAAHLQAGPAQAPAGPAASPYAQQAGQGTYQPTGSYTAQQLYQQQYAQAQRAAYQQQYQQGSYQQGAYAQGSYQQAQNRPVNPYTQQQYQQAQQQYQQTQRQYQQTQRQAQPQAEQQYQQSYEQAAAEEQVAAEEKPAKKKQASNWKTALVGAAGGAVASLAIVLALQGSGALGKARVVVPTGQSSAGQVVTITPESEDVTVAQAVAAKALPSVVSVYVASMDSQGLGSGVILDTDGNILTNWHVAGDANAISVTIGGKSYEATLVGGDPSSDLAVVHADLQGDSVTPIEVGDSNTLVVGDWVMTIGSPFGLDQSVSAGIVSSLARNELMKSTYGTTIYANLIQTDATINPGNSGGALVNSQGQLVGVPTLFSSDTESFAGIGFAIPGNYAIEIANKIIAGEQVTHAYIGLSMQTVNAQNAEANHLSVNQGAYVAEVAQGGPAEAVGIQVGDIIIAMGDTQITSADGMILAVRSHSTGETVPVTVMRGSEQLTFDVTLGSDEQLQALQQQQNEQLQQQQQQQYEEQQWGYPQGDGNGGNGYNDFFEELYDYLYNNNHGGSLGLGE